MRSTCRPPRRRRRPWKPERWLAGLLGLALLHPAGAQAAAPRAAWIQSALTADAAASVVHWQPGQAFGSALPATRLDLAVWLARAAVLAAGTGAPAFADEARIPAADQGLVAQARAAGLVHGYPDGRFHPDRPVSRLQAAVLIGRALAHQGATPTPWVLARFSDAAALPAWAVGDVSIAVAQGVLQGVPTPSGGLALDPNAIATRAQAAALLARYLPRRSQLLAAPARGLSARPLLAAYALAHSNSSYLRLLQSGGRLNAVVATGYTVLSDGQAAGRISARLAQWDTQTHIPVLVMFGATATVDPVLQSQAARNRAATTMAAAARPYAGAVIDLERAAAGDQAAFTSLVCQTAQILHARGQVLWVAVPAESAGYNPATHPASHWVAAYNLHALAGCADMLALMTYDEHWQGGTPGPIAGLPWVQDVVRYAVSQAPAGKYLLGFPGYAYDWSSTSNVTPSLGASAALALAQAQGVSPVFDPVQQEDHFNYTANGSLHTVWVPTIRSTLALAAVARAHGMAGMIDWRLGREPAGTWRALAGAWPAG